MGREIYEILNEFYPISATTITLSSLRASEKTLTRAGRATVKQTANVEEAEQV